MWGNIFTSECKYLRKAIVPWGFTGKETVVPLVPTNGEWLVSVDSA